MELLICLITREKGPWLIIGVTMNSDLPPTSLLSVRALPCGPYSHRITTAHSSQVRKIADSNYNYSKEIFFISKYYTDGT